jgi:hypothetical protein
VVAWHLHDPPRSETAMATALPLRGLPAWRVYLSFGTDDIVVVFAPEDKHDDLQERLSGRPRFASRMQAIASNMPPFVDARGALSA